MADKDRSMRRFLLAIPLTLLFHAIDFENGEGFKLATADKQTLMFSKKDFVPVATDYLQTFTGKYYSKEGRLFERCFANAYV